MPCIVELYLKISCNSVVRFISYGFYKIRCFRRNFIARQIRPWSIFSQFFQAVPLFLGPWKKIELLTPTHRLGKYRNSHPNWPFFFTSLSQKMLQGQIWQLASLAKLRFLAFLKVYILKTSNSMPLNLFIHVVQARGC